MISVKSILNKYKVLIDVLQFIFTIHLIYITERFYP